MGFKVSWEDEGMSDDDDDVFETRAEAEAHALIQVDNFHSGAEVLHMSNPGDYPDDDDEDPQFKIVEVD